MDFSALPAGMPRIASWEAKWGADGSGAGAGAERSAEFAGTKSVFPTDIDEALIERMQETAVNAFAALRLRDYARIDLRVTAEGDRFRYHFHEDDAGVYADVKVAGDWERVQVDGAPGRQRVVRLLRTEHVDSVR